MADVPLIKLDGAATDGQVPTADGAGSYAWETPSAGSTGVVLLEHATKTSTQSAITSVVDISGLSAEVTVDAGRLIRVDIHVRVMLKNSSGSNAATRGFCNILRGATSIGAGLDRSLETRSGTNHPWTASGFTFDTPASGTHTYKVTAQAIGTTASIDIEASAGGPCWIAVYDCGPA